MKIEKLNEDKIRITLNLKDLEDENIDFHTFMSNPIESQDIFLDMLEKAEKEVGFITDDYRLMIEALAMNDGNFILTVTRIETEKKERTCNKNKKVNYKRKATTISSDIAIYRFETFDDFCEFCTFANNGILHNLNNFAKSISLYSYNEKYYLVFSQINVNSNLLKIICSSITEFAHFVSESSLFINKLSEHGNLLIKDSAISTCLKHFCNK